MFALVAVFAAAQDPVSCAEELLFNGATALNCAQRACTCAGGTWTDTFPYCNGETVACTAAQHCFPLGLTCLMQSVPDCEAYVADAC